MASDPPSERRPDLTESSMTVPSDSENYSSSNNELSSSPPSSSSSPLILYSPPTLWGLLRGAAINLLLPFVNGLMLGFGELLAHEAAFRLGWSGTKVFPSGRSSRSVGPGVEMRGDPTVRRQRKRELDDMTSLE
ncbi:MAG: hypothetical protein Q9211_001020 [Gyalolechia sp. 1 TL-2023]